MIDLNQNEIMAKWHGDARNPLVSINCITYNHEAYIAQTLDSFLIQKTNFPFEILINDDASKDHTAEIIKQYEIKFSQIIKPIYQKENQFSQRVNVLGINNKRAKGKYIALCEGDDYWTDPNKLQRQFDQLEKNPSYAAVAENGIILFTHSGEKRLFSNEPERNISLNELLIRRRFPTASVMYREQLNEYIDNHSFTVDTIIWGILSQYGLIHYSPIVSSVYRRGDGVTEKNKIQWAYFSEKINIHVNKIFKPDKKIKRIRNQTLYYDLKNGRVDSQKKHLHRQSIIFLLKMLKTCPILFIKDFFRRMMK